MRADRLLTSFLAIAGLVGSSARAQIAPPEPPPLPEVARGLRTVVVDPGHGGDDPGVTGPLGLTEAEIVLDVGRRLEKIFEARLGVQRIVLTRAGDANVGIASRISTANGSKGDVLVSLHVAGSVRPEAAGPRVYSMGAGLRIVELAERRLRPRARRLLAGQVEAEGSTDLRLTPWALAQQEYAARSAGLAASVARELRESTGHDVPVSAQPLAILAGTRMPAVLVELGYLTNPEEEGLFKRGDHRGKLAGALFRGITSFALPGALAAQDRPEEPAAAE